MRRDLPAGDQRLGRASVESASGSNPLKDKEVGKWARTGMLSNVVPPALPYHIESNIFRLLLFVCNAPRD